ncbi:MAG: LysE family transporter [Pontibacterium sp.]
MSFDIWLAFFAACWVISLSPGAGAIASMTSGLKHGFWYGYWNVIGLQLALIAQIAIVATGLGAVLAASETVFNLIKWFGVGYLLFLAYQQWTQATIQIQDADEHKSSVLKLVIRGFVVNTSNPKAIIFMLAVIPQFIEPAQPLLAQYTTMTLTMVGVDMFVMAGYTLLAAKVLKFLRTRRQQKMVSRGFAGMFVGAAAFLATVNRAT